MTDRAGRPNNDKVAYRDDPNSPRDPDNPAETRLRFVPSGLANEIQLDVYARPVSFEPGVPLPQRLFDAYAAEVARVDTNADGVISFSEADAKRHI